MFHVKDGRAVAIGAFLPDVAECRQFRDLPDDFEFFLFLLFLEPALQFGMVIKVVLDRALVPPRDKNNILDPPRLARRKARRASLPSLIRLRSERPRVESKRSSGERAIMKIIKGEG